MNLACGNISNTYKYPIIQLNNFVYNKLLRDGNDRLLNVHEEWRSSGTLLHFTDCTVSNTFVLSL